MKRKVLMVNEAHYISSGYGTYGANILKRLAAHPDLEVAELASYGFMGQEQNCTWKYYANAIHHKHPDHELYISHSQNEHGRWRFDRVLLDFKPDIVFDIRDPWAVSFEQSSGLRPYYHLCIMPTVDSAPQKPDWIELFLNADAVFSYSRYGREVLREATTDINFIDIASPAVDTEVFKPVQNKAEHKQIIGLPKNALVVGTVMRNFNRKLHADLMVAFKIFIDKCYAAGRKDLADRTYLYIHTSYPDMAGWDIPELLIENELTNKVIFTYKCKHCESIFSAFFNDSKTICQNCHTKNATMSSTDNGINPSALATIINLFDLYVQYSTCEGFGMPQLEAAGCGVPVMGVDYSATSEVISDLRGIALKPQRMFRDLANFAYRALPNNEECANEIYSFLSLPEPIRLRKNTNTRKAVEAKYSWDKTAQVWIDYFLSAKLTGRQGQWNAPKLPINPPPTFNPRKDLDNYQYIDWLIKDVLQDPKKCNTKFALDAVRRLENVVNQEGKRIKTFTRRSMYEQFARSLENRQILESIRCGLIDAQNEDYIDYANSKYGLSV